MLNIVRALANSFRKPPSSRTPTQALLETTNKCNLNCSYCMQGQATKYMEEHGHASHDLMTRPMGVMPQESFDIIRKRLKQFGIKKVYLHFHGEPMLNKHTPAFATQLKQDGFWVGMFTNGQAFTEKTIQGLKTSSIDLIRFSVDGASEETYQANRQGGTFEKVYETMQHMAQEFKGTPTRLEWQFIALRNNEHELETVREMAKKTGVDFILKGFRETDPSLAPTNPKLRATYRTKPCMDIFKQLCVCWNGDVVPCCYDVDATEVMGNVVEQDLEAIWDSPKYTDFRARVLALREQPEAEPELCRDCLRWK